MGDKIVTLDMREEMREGGEPFSKLKQTVSDLQEGEALLLITPFKPVPLFRVMKGKTFHGHAEPLTAQDWEHLLHWQPPARPAQDTFQCCRDSSLVVEVDARGLEPPQPLMVILEAVAHLPTNVDLEAFTDERPIHLYEQLGTLGFTGETKQGVDGSFITYIRRLA